LPRISSASLSGPAVPRGSDSTEKVILMPKLLAYYDTCVSNNVSMIRAYRLDRITYITEVLLHGLRLVVDCENNIGDTSFDESFNLMNNHGLVAELNQWLGKSQGLVAESAGWMYDYWICRS